MKEVGTEPVVCLLKKIEHTFTKETLAKLRIGGGRGFILPLEEEKFHAMLKKHGQAFAFSPAEIGCADPSIIERISNFYSATYVVEP
jgi:hypothetical protein